MVGQIILENKGTERADREGEIREIFFLMLSIFEGIGSLSVQLK